MLTGQRLQVVALTFCKHEILSEVQSSPQNTLISESTVRMLLQDEVAFRHIIILTAKYHPGNTETLHCFLNPCTAEVEKCVPRSCIQEWTKQCGIKKKSPKYSQCCPKDESLCCSHLAVFCTPTNEFCVGFCLFVFECLTHY